jgi:hypothetical protein
MGWDLGGHLMRLRPLEDGLGRLPIWRECKNELQLFAVRARLSRVSLGAAPPSLLNAGGGAPQWPWEGALAPARRLVTVR